MTILVLSVVLIGQSFVANQKAYAAPCENLAITGVTASGSQSTHPALHAIDKNLATRWAWVGNGTWLQVDLGSEMTICSVDIAWYRGNLRSYNFIISVSDDATNFRDVFTGKSSGTTLSPERYNFTDVSGKFVRITINRNTENDDWASISEIGINGVSSAPPPSHNCPQGQHWDDTQQKCVDDIVTPPSSSGGNDKFGVKEIYPSKSNGEEWFFNADNPGDDSRTDPPDMSKVSDGIWNVKSDKVRYNVFTSAGYHQEDITTYNQEKLAEKEYMQSPQDWKNVEITGYVKLNSGSDDQFTWYTHGGRHTADEPCEGTAYKGELEFDGHTRFAKEQWHPGGYSFTSSKSSTDPIEGKWVGHKVVVYDFTQNGKRVVKLEIWLDVDNNNQWNKVYDYVDDGGFGDEGEKCGGAPDQIMTWGGPLVSFRWDNADDVDIQKFSVREIQPPQ